MRFQSRPGRPASIARAPLHSPLAMANRLCSRHPIATGDAFASPERLATVLAYGDIELDREKHRVVRAGRPIDLGPTEYRLLEFFLEHPGRVFSREQLLDAVWGSDVYVEARTVDVHVGRLRSKLKTAGRQIETVVGLGYRFVD